MREVERTLFRQSDSDFRAGAQGNFQDAKLVPELTAREQAWRRDIGTVSLPEVHRRICDWLLEQARREWYQLQIDREVRQSITCFRPMRN